jgi:serine/threonine protein kinase
MQEIENSLPVGTKLDNRYVVESILGEGGFGITYKAHDEKLACDVAIKEYLPTECAARTSDSVSVQPRTNRGDDYQYGLDRFLEEARTLAKFQHSNIVRVSNFIEENGTAYLVMEFAEGVPLDEWLKKKSDSVDEKTILQIITPLLKGLAEVHKAGLMHRDIKPGNIFLRKKGGPLLIDFGAARQALGEHSKSISAIISMGYAPPEQYTTRGKQGPYTDLYAVGAVIYKLITGGTPVESPDRSHDIHEGEPDPLVPAISVGKGKIDDWLLEITDQLLNISPKQRPQSAEAVIEAIQNKTNINLGAASAVQTPTEKNEPKTRVVKSSERFSKPAKNKAPATSKQNNKSNTGIIAAVTIVIAVVAAGGWWFIQNNPEMVSSQPIKSTTPVKTLAKGKAILIVDSQPSGVSVYIDDIKIGKTPYKGDALPAGKHQLKLVHEEYQNEIAELNLQDNIILKKSYTLKGASGNLSIFSQPDGASIFIDGKKTTLTTPATVLNVKAGKRQLKLHKDAYYDLIKTIQVKKGETIRGDYNLEGGDLVKHQGKWIEPKERSRLLAEIEQKKRDAEEVKRKEAEARLKAAEIKRKEEAARLKQVKAEQKAAEEKRKISAAKIRKQARAAAKKDNVNKMESLLTEASQLVQNNREDQAIRALIKPKKTTIRKFSKLENKPFVLAYNSRKGLTATKKEVHKKLIQIGFQIVGSYSPYANAYIYVVTNKALKSNAAKTEFGGYGATQRISLTKIGGVTQVSYTNPTYMSYAYHMKGNLKGVADQLRSALGFKKVFGTSNTLTDDGLRKYHYTFGMEYFDEPVDLASKGSHKEAVQVIEDNLGRKLGGAYKVYRVDIPGSNQTVFGVGIKGSGSSEKFQDDAFIMGEIDFRPERSTAHLPIEILVAGNSAYILAPRFRIPINFPDLAMMGDNSFMNIMVTPDSITKVLTAIAGGTYDGP